MDRVVTKLCLQPSKMVLVSPHWPNTPWARLLEKITLRSTTIPQGTPLYFGDWDTKPLPSPQWETNVSLVDTSLLKVDAMELDPQVVAWVKRKCKGWGIEELLTEMSKYPSFTPKEEWRNGRQPLLQPATATAVAFK